jgi:GNAT superfamily N-acetyltransferase
MELPEADVRQATIADLDLIAPLFDAYREFYRKPAETERARRFLLDRFSNNQSIVFLAFHADEAVGFAQLYPSFSSGSLGRILILNDLFVAPEARRQGAGAWLLEAAANYGRQIGALRLTLSTEHTNTAAQSLYERSGWKRDAFFCSYNLTL